MAVDKKENEESIKKMMQVILLVVGGAGVGGVLGFTVEPKETTELRVENGVLKERTLNLEKQVTMLGMRVELLEQIVDSCRNIIKPGTEK
jgi:hypothetical protein